MKNTNIKTIAFDMGGVIFNFSREQAVNRFKELGLEDADQWLDDYTQKGIFGQVESGEISALEFVSELSKLVGHHLTWKECQSGWTGYFVDMPQRNLDTLLQLKAEGYRLLLVTNTNPFMMSWVKSNEFDKNGGHGIDYYVDKIYASYECRHMKPSEEYFLHVLEQEGMPAENILFIDDSPRNVAAAKKMGFHTYQPANGADWTQEIRKYL